MGKATLIPAYSIFVLNTVQVESDALWTHVGIEAMQKRISYAAWCIASCSAEHVIALKELVGAGQVGGTVVSLRKNFKLVLYRNLRLSCVFVASCYPLLLLLLVSICCALLVILPAWHDCWRFSIHCPLLYYVCYF